MKREEYYRGKIEDKDKKYINSVQHLREVLYDYQPSLIWWDDFSKETPYMVGHYVDKKFNGSYVGQKFLTFELDSLSQLESIFKEGMYIYV